MAVDITPSLPKFDPKKVYLVKGKTMNDIMATLKTYRPRVVTGGGLKIDSQSEDGTYLSLISAGVNLANIHELNLAVCVNNVSVTHTFLITR